MPILTRIFNPIDFIHRIWQSRKAFSGYNDIIIRRIVNFFRKIFTCHKSIALINKQNAILHQRQSFFPISPFQNTACFFTNQFNPTVFPVFVILTNHINQRCFTRCTISTNNRNIPTNLKIIFYFLILNTYSIFPFHSNTPTHIILQLKSVHSYYKQSHLYLIYESQIHLVQNPSNV